MKPKEIKSEDITDKLIDRFMLKVNQRGNLQCWDWIACIDKGGYGQFSINSRMQLAHRVSYVIFIGGIPDGKVLDHTCKNTKCVNPIHLEPVTQKENILRGASPSAIGAKKTYCKRGHNIRLKNAQTKDGACRKCLPLYWQEYKLRLAGL